MGESLTPVDIVKFTAAYGSWVLERYQNPKIVIGRDARISGEMVSKLVAATLQGLGINVIDLGLSTRRRNYYHRKSQSYPMERPKAVEQQRRIHL